MRKWLVSISAIVLTFSLAGGGVAQAGELIRLSSGTITGSWYPLMTLIGEKVLKPEGFNYSNKPGGGVSNVFAVGLGKADMGLSMGTALDMAAKGQGPFKKKVQGLVMLSSLFPDPFHLVVTESSGIKKFTDIKGKRMGTAKRGQFSEVVFDDVLNAFGMNKGMMTLRPGSQSEAKALMKDRHIDAWNYVSPVPNRHVMEMVLFQKLRLLSLPDDKIQQISKSRQGYIPTIIPKGTYPTQNYDVKTFYTPVGLIVHKRMSNGTAYKIAQALVKHIDVIRGAGAKALKTITPQKMANVGASPLHPGAKRFYKEKGYLK